MKKGDYPLAIANLLGIPPIQGRAGPWMSSEGTVLGDWVRAVAEAMDVTYINKVTTMRALVEAVGQSWDPTSMSSETTASAGGGNTRTPGFAALLHGLQGQPNTSVRRHERRAGYLSRSHFQVAKTDSLSLRAIRVRLGANLPPEATCSRRTEEDARCRMQMPRRFSRQRTSSRMAMEAHMRRPTGCSFDPTCTCSSTTSSHRGQHGRLHRGRSAQPRTVVLRTVT